MMKKVFFYMSGNLHNAYRQMLANPPDGFRYQKSENMGIRLGKRGLSGTMLRLRPLLSPLYNHFLICANRPKTRRFEGVGYDLVHSCQSLLDTNVPYVVDFEHVAVFSGFNQYAFSRDGFRRALVKKFSEKNLKKLIAWTNAAKKSFTNAMHANELEEKLEVVYPVITPPEKLEKTKHEGFNFLFMGKVFFEKGGYECLLAFDKISRKHDCRLSVVSPVPEALKQRFSGNPGINFLENVPYSEVKKLYLESDALLFPTHYDTVGFVIPEAFSYGVPVITTDHFSSPEMVEHEKTGLVIKGFYSNFGKDFGYRHHSVQELGRERLAECMKPPEWYVSELASGMERLLSEPKLHNKLSLNARKEATKGKFSPKIWKEKIGRIYEEVLTN